MKRPYFTLIALLLIAPVLSAQESRDTNCTYERCALGLAPVWNGLAVTRGDSQDQVANLGFFWPGDVSRAFAGDRQAVDAARDAAAIRQIGAALTDGGIILVTTAVARGLFHRDWDKLSTTFAIAGGAALGASVPFQFAADGLLSRAVWLFNRKYAR